MIVEALTIQYLGAALNVPVSGQVPADRPPEFVTVERTGGATSQVYDWPNLAVQSWGASRADAAILADTVRDLLMGMVSLPMVARVDVGSSYNWPDPDSKQARYQTTVSLVIDRSEL